MTIDVLPASRLRRSVVLSTLVAFALCSVTAAWSQQSTEEVIVTARRRDENLSSVPLAITALSAEQISARSTRTAVGEPRTDGFEISYRYR